MVAGKDKQQACRALEFGQRMAHATRIRQRETRSGIAEFEEEGRAHFRHVGKARTVGGRVARDLRVLGRRSSKSEGGSISTPHFHIGQAHKSAHAVGDMSLSAAELQRYSRHLLIPQVGREGQERLKAASVLLIGSGALGSPAAMYLAAAGVGRLGLVDDDVVDVSNLQRQVLHGESWIGTAKLESAAARLREINPHVILELHPLRFAAGNAMEIAASYDLIVDGSDNFPTRFLTNDTAFFQRKPLVYGAIHRFEGQASVFAPHLGGPCYRCLLPQMPAPGSVPSCAEAGVLGVLPGIIGSIQAM